MTSKSLRRPWWAIGALAVGGLWMLFVGCLFFTGHWATVTVTGGAGDGFCDVVWEDPGGERHSGESDCYDEPAGSSFQVRVSGWPDAGEPTLLGTYVGMGLVLGLPPVAAGAGRLLVLALRARLPARPHLATPEAPEGSGGALADERTARAIGPATRRVWTLTGLGALGACVVVSLAVVEIRADEDLRAVGVTTAGTVLEVEPDTLWSAGTASVHFTADGRTAARTVSLGGYADDYVEGDAVRVIYDPSDPYRFIVDDALYGPDWTRWVLVPSLMVAVVAAPSGISGVSRVRQMRRLLAGHTWTPVRTQVRYDGMHWEFITDPREVWRASRYVGWPKDDREPGDLSGWGLPDEDPADVPTDQPAWWVSDGAIAVFSPDRGRPLVFVRRR